MSSVTSAVAMAMRLETTLALAMMPLATVAVTMWAMHLAAGADALGNNDGDVGDALGGRCRSTSRLRR